MGPLTDKEIKNASVWTTDYKMCEPGGLYLLVKPNGSKWWRLRYSVRGVQNKFQWASIRKFLSPGQSCGKRSQGVYSQRRRPPRGAEKGKGEKRGGSNRQVRRDNFWFDRRRMVQEKRGGVGSRARTHYPLASEQIRLALYRRRGHRETENRGLREADRPDRKQEFDRYCKKVGQLCGQITRYARVIGVLECDTAGASLVS